MWRLVSFVKSFVALVVGAAPIRELLYMAANKAPASKADKRLSLLSPEFDPMSFKTVSFVYTIPSKLIKSNPAAVYFTVTTKED